MIITNKNGKYELTDEFPNDVRLKTPWNSSVVIVHSSSQNKNVVNTSKILLKPRYRTFPLEQCFT